jgi:hypothetical protein
MNKPAPKRRQNNATCNTIHGVTGFNALHGTTQHSHHDNTAKLVKGHQREREAINKLLTLVEKRKGEYTEACITAMEAAHVARRRRVTVLLEGETIIVTKVSLQRRKEVEGESKREETTGWEGRILNLDRDTLQVTYAGRRICSSKLWQRKEHRRCDQCEWTGS